MIVMYFVTKMNPVGDILDKNKGNSRDWDHLNLEFNRLFSSPKSDAMNIKLINSCSGQYDLWLYDTTNQAPLQNTI